MDASSFTRQKPAPVAKTKKKGKNKSKPKKKSSTTPTKKLTTYQEIEDNYLEAITKGQQRVLSSDSSSSSNSSISCEDCSDGELDDCPFSMDNEEQKHHDGHVENIENSCASDSESFLFNIEDVLKSNAGITDTLLQNQMKFAEIFRTPYVFSNNAELFSNHLAHLSEQIKATFNLSSAIITGLSCVFAQNQQLQLQNIKLNSQLKEALHRIQFLTNQNAKATLNSTQLLQRNIELAEKIKIQNNEQQQFREQMKFQTSSIQQTTASIRLNLKHPQSQPSKPYARALKTGIIPSQVLTAIQANPTTALSDILQSDTPNTTKTNKFNSNLETSFTLKITAVSNFQSPQEFMNKHLRVLQIKHKLPKIMSIFGEKDTLNVFRLRFDSPNDRQLWHTFFATTPELVSSSQLLNLNSTKIRMKGVPTALVQKGPIHLANLFCDHFKLQHSELKQIFQFEEKLSPGFSIVAFAISPNARRIFHSQGDSFYLDQYDFAVTIEDFLQPLQCSKCQQFGHPSKRCLNKKICTNCSKHSCPSNNTNQTCCQDIFCINCGQYDHSPNQREKCPAYQDIFNVAFTNLTNILSEDRLSPALTTATQPALSEENSTNN
jgi:hypothetical protein